MIGPFEIERTMAAGGDKRAHWKHVVGLALIHMREHGWGGAKLLNAQWSDGRLWLRIGPGYDTLTPELVGKYIRDQRKAAK